VTAEAQDHRVEFDFELDFSNGGALQGQGFRLDIDGDSISDGELAAYLVTDLRLLMVGEVRILRKRVLRERHKRRAKAAVGTRTRDGRTRIDLSHAVEDGMVTYRGLPAPIVCDYLSHERSRDRYGGESEFHFGFVGMVSNTGTWVDAPFHRYRDGIDLAELPLDRLVDLDAVTVNLDGSRTRAIERAALAPYDVNGRAVLIHTGWDRHWGTDAYFDGHPFLAGDAARHLVEQDVTLVGIDSLNVDDTDDAARPAHSALLAAGIPICEHMTNLAALPGDGYRFSAVPVKVRALGTFPVRATAVLAPATSAEGVASAAGTRSDAGTA
jgi:kynurenine formamidase